MSREDEKKGWKYSRTLTKPTAEQILAKAKQDVAKRCAEIASETTYNTLESPGEYEGACLDVYDAIVEEFNLEARWEEDE